MASSKARRSFFVVLIVILVLGGGGFIAREIVKNSASLIQAYETSDPTASKKVYIALDNSVWKLEVVKKLIANFQGKANFKVENLNTLANLDIAAWDAVIVVAPYRMAALQSDASSFASTHRENPKLVMLITAGNSQVSLTGVDVIGAASDDTENVVAQTTAHLNKILGF